MIPPPPGNQAIAERRAALQPPSGRYVRMPSPHQVVEAVAALTESAAAAELRRLGIGAAQDGRHRAKLLAALSR